MTELKSEVRSRRKGAITRQIILFEAERSFAKMGYQQTSITSIAETLKMSAANIHKHFRSKLDLAYAVVEQRLRPVQVIAGVTPKERLRALPLNILGDLSHMSQDEPELFYILTNILSTENVSDIMRSRILDACPQVIEDMELSDAERFSEALADIFLAVCHPAIVATTEYRVLVSRVDNILNLMKQVMDIGASAPLAKAC
ncbi:TetR/AcrR family transcriptional regulator [Rhizobium sp. CG4]|jgi:TetR/AcrR family transcriptional repressor of the ameABC operon|uniref:TetR/AcrR family transcriptional regulator n=1 Tax=Rhizobium/Agrobacterium group TaxID=227290 RepID=UPI0017877605|nr:MULTISPECIES: TetR/AcrR family transcriptional regulator [Rhizobium/Agrobacterium group]MBD9389707.1 TetR/AcrR family transcriptional regulator [Agrobacterium sp. AGB01]MCM2456556.1 TetR/AcrR family transcriptional regulator [Rhizobium sp. CG4]MCS4244165.1 TetR/AcrR family transcriptional repressor of the ameABC operon [Rhizobium sp. BIGb0125]MDO5898737.1 TetR/AcrR family transcriptional regulator [Agrobacterium sp. Azo12]